VAAAVVRLLRFQPVTDVAVLLARDQGKTGMGVDSAVMAEIPSGAPDPRTSDPAEEHGTAD